MAWFIVTFIVLPVSGLIFLLPYPAFRGALANRNRTDGTRSPNRSKREREHAVNFASQVVLIPLIVVGVVGSALVAVHEFVVPIPLLVDVMGAYETDAVAWERAIELEPLGDVGAQYEDWSSRRGFEKSTARFWQETLWENWATILLILVLLGSVFYVAVSKFYIHASASYQNGVRARAVEYQLRDSPELREFQRAAAEWSA